MSGTEVETEDDDDDICRVCRTPATVERPLFHPCICTGSIRHIHQDCLLQWLQHSRKEYCELCSHKYNFKPIYSPDMPTRLPLSDLMLGLFRSISSAVRCWVHYTIVAVCWLCIVPLTAYRIYNCIFAGSMRVLITLPVDMISTRNLVTDILNGCVVVACTVSAFICLLWLRMHVLNGDLPAWLVPHAPVQPEPANNDNEPANDNVEDEELENEDANNNNNEQAENPPPQHEQANNINWNAIDWDHWENPGAEPTWERVLGLDGSFLFLEHIFWVVALNTLFILVFAFCPYHLGHFFLVNTDLKRVVISTRFEGVLTALCGYVLITFGFLVSHALLKLTRLHWSGHILGICYIILKVGLLVLIEIGVFPVICGVWLDVCTLQVFNSTLQQRHDMYAKLPGTFVFCHWVAGIVFVFYFTTFVVMLREVLRPGVLWFIRNLNEPDFNPIREMIHLPMHKHARRFAITVIVFGTIIVLIAWLPIQLLLLAVPGFLPYHSASLSASPIGDFPLQVMAIQFVLPTLLEQAHIRVGAKICLGMWALFVGRLLGVQSYLLGDDGLGPHVEHIQQDGDEQHVEVQQWPVNFKPYTKPMYFSFRIILLLVIVAASLVIVFTLIFYIPVTIGRTIVNFVFGPNGWIIPSTPTDGKQVVLHELYTFSFGIHFCWGMSRLVTMMTNWAPWGLPLLRTKICDAAVICVKSSVIFFFVLGVIPFQLGLLFDITIVIPMRVAINQTPVIFLWQDWALGILLLKLCFVMILLGPDNPYKQTIDRAYQQGFLRLSMSNLIRDALFPPIYHLLTMMAIPYAFGQLLPIVFGVSLETEYFFRWRIHLVMLFALSVITFGKFEMMQFQRLCSKIKNDRYLIGQRLIDYEPKPIPPTPS